MTSLSEFAGHLHPVLLHFPIALLWVGGVAEAARVRHDSPFLARAVVWLMALGAVSALAASGSGWLLAAYEQVRSDQRSILEWHRWLGILTTGWAAVAWFAAARWQETAPRALRYLRRGLIWSTAGILTAAAHFGATIVWGKDWFFSGTS